MLPEIRRKRDALENAVRQIRWCDDRRFALENDNDVAPGGFINPFGWFVIGTTVGGNAIVVAGDDPGVYFADHSWYSDSGIECQNLAGDRSWLSLPLSPDGVRASFFKLADSVDEFVRNAEEIDRTIDRID